VVSTKGRSGDSERKYLSEEKPILPDVPLIVLVNGGSASASEIVCGAIQDLDRGLIVGSHTFGKGLVQTVTRLSDKTSLKMTTARYFTPSGRSIQVFDYSHRGSDGSATMVPDSLRRAFQTTGGRRVYEAGGIMPDSTVSEMPPSNFLEALNRNAVIFKFVSRQVASKKNFVEPFKATDEILEDFEAYLKEVSFHYKEEAELYVENLQASAVRERYEPAFGENVNKLMALIEREKERKVQRYGKELKAAIESEMLARTKGDRARIESTFAHDEQLTAAIGLLKNRTLYNRMLNSEGKK
jgi:carboxyl-terminal processing protease